MSERTSDSLSDNLSNGLSGNLAIKALTFIKKDGTRFLGPFSHEFRPGEITLIAGPSGSGKSTLARALTGLADEIRGHFRIEGTATINSRQYELASESPKLGAMVFQNGALFDDLPVQDNIKIALDHVLPDEKPYLSKTSQEEPVNKRQRLFENLLAGIRGGQQVQQLSGGQKQRVAIARTICSQNAFLVLDEPNSGLDIVNSRKLAEQIAVLAKERQLSVLIIAHHVEELAPIADHAFVVDRVTGELRRIEPDQTAIQKAILSEDERYLVDRDKGADRGDEAQNSPLLQLVTNKKRSSGHFYWQTKFFSHYLYLLLFSPSALIYMMLGAATLGFVSIWFPFTALPFNDTLGAAAHDRILTGLGGAQARIMLPLLFCLLLAARNSALITADLGHRVYTDQIRAMNNLGIPVRSYLLGNIITANLAGFILGAFLVYGIAIIASLETWQWLFPDRQSFQFREAFFSRVPGLGRPFWPGMGWLLFKLGVSSVAISLFAIWTATRPKLSVRDLNTAIARSIIVGVSLVLLVHTAIAVAEFTRYIGR